MTIQDSAQHGKPSVWLPFTKAHKVVCAYLTLSSRYSSAGIIACRIFCVFDVLDQPVGLHQVTGAAAVAFYMKLI